MISPADIITLMNFLCGIFAVMYSIDGGDGFRKAMIFIMIGMIFDGLDGPAARKFGSSHRFGVWLDSLADSMTFCIAPAILVYNLFKDPSAGWMGSIQGFLAVISAVSIALMGILRLAKFSLYAHKWKDFIGLPTPAMAMFVVSISASYYWSTILEIDILWVTSGHLVVIPLLFFMSSFTMLADMRYRKFKGKMLILSGLLVLLITLGQLFGLINNTIGLTSALILSVLSVIYLISPILDGPGRIWGASKWADVVEDDVDIFDDMDDEIPLDRAVDERLIK